MAIDERQVRELALLAHLGLSEDELHDAAGHLERLLAYVEEVLAIDTSGSSEADSLAGSAAPLRPDVVLRSLPRVEALAAAPSAAAGLFEVPRVIASRAPSTRGASGDGDASDAPE